MADIDYSKLSDAELEALASGDYSKLSDATLQMLAGQKPAERPAAPAPAERKSRFPELPRDVRTPTDVSPGRGASGLLGIPGGLLDIATGITGIFGENAVTRQLREMEQRLSEKAPVKETYEAGKIVPQIVPAAATAKVVSKIPVASQTARALLQATGQAGQAAAVTHSAVEGEEDRGMFGLGPRETAALLEGTLGLAGEAAVPLTRRGVDFARTMRDRFSDRITGLSTTPVTEQERAALAISQKMGQKADESTLADVAKAQQEAAARKAELDAIKARQADAKAAQERERQALVAQKKAAEEAEAKALETVELTPTRGKQELGQRLRDVVTTARQKYMDARNQAIGKYESGDEVPVFTAAKEMEAQDQFINSTDQFKGLVKFLRERGTGKLGKQELIAEERRAFAKALKEITPTQRVVEEVVDEAGNVAKTEKLVPLPISFEKLVKLRRRIAGQDPGVAETGFEAIKGKTRENILKKIDDALEGFSPGYLDYKKAYAEASEPLDFLKVNSVGKKAATFQKFSQEQFQANPEAVLDALLNNPSKTNADNLLKFVGNENKDEIEQVVLEALVNKAGGKSSGYTKVLEKYDDFLNAFPTAKNRLQEEAGVFEKATAPARAEFEKATAGLEGIKLAKANEKNLERIARAEFNKADAVRVATQDRVKALNQLDEDTLISISEAANKIPLDTSLGLAQATALAAVGYGASELLLDSPLGGLLGIAGGLMRRRQAKNAFATKKQEVANKIETELRRIISDTSGARAASIQTRIDNEASIMSAQRLANQALRNLGIKPGSGAVTANTIYKAFATDKGADAVSEEPSEPEGEEGLVPGPEGEPESAVDGESYDMDAIIADRGADDLAPLIKSIYEQESSSGKAQNLDKENYAGAKGPMQVTRDTFDAMRNKGMLPEDYSFDNVSHLAEAGVVLIQDLAKRYGNDPQKIAAAYYSGPRAVTDKGIRRDFRDLENPKAPTVGQYVDQVLSRMMPTAEASQMAEGGSVDAERQRIEAEIKKHPWYSEFCKEFNECPNLGQNADYDYITAWKAGIRPERDPYDKNRYHWSSMTGDGVMLKKPGHPTMWKTLFMEQTGKNPDAIGIKSKQEAQAYINAQRVKKARGGYTIQEELLLKRYANR